MNILQLANKLPYPPKDGGSIATFNLTRAFRELGCDVTVLAINTSKHYFDPVNIPEKYSSVIDFRAVPVNIDIHPLKALNNLLFSKMPYNAVRFIDRNFMTKLVEILTEKDFDVIQLEGLYLAPYIPVIREHSKALISMRAHNVEHEIWKRSALNSSGLKKRYLQNLSGRIRRMEIESLNMFDVIVPITGRDEAVFKTLGFQKPSHVTPTGIFTSELKIDRSNPDFPSLFHLGALDWPPNQEGIFWFLEKVWKQLHKKHPDLKFYIAGRNASDRIRDIREAGVVYLGEVDNAYDFMNSKAIMVVPLLSGSGMRIKIIEGMALGKTIVSTNIGAEGIGASHDENILLADKPEDFSTEIERILNDRKKFEAIGNNAMTFINENYDNLRITESLLNFYNQFV